MKREYKKQSLFDSKPIGRLVFSLFVVFIAYKILTPPSDETARIDSPDGTKTARLKTEYYFDNQPSYRIFYREKDKKVWLKIYSLPAYTNLPPESAKPEIEWSADSTQLDFLMNGTSIWQYVFEN
ncbi:MAG: hypothetical protein OES84_00370 [Kiritimatiellaceae bacterium]|nr:hypothetical protein [Kiritimatiellaceae bacterium]